MSESTNRPRGAESKTDDPVIRPIAYRPQQAATSVSQQAIIFRGLIAAVSLVIATVFWFLFTANSVRLEFTPDTPAVKISGGIALPFGDVWLMRRGSFVLHATAAGYQPLTTDLEVDTVSNQVFRFELLPLPGRIRFESEPPGASVVLAGESLGQTPLVDISVPAGQVTVQFNLDRYEPLTVVAEVEGMEHSQTISAELLPGWANIAVASLPTGAEILIDDQPTGARTPATVEMPAGEHELQLRTRGYKAYRQRMLVAAREQVELPEVRLERADGVLRVETRPAGAGITLNGQYQGESPIEIAVQSGINYRVQAFSAGYGTAVGNLTLTPGATRTVNLSLERLMGRLVVQAEPLDAELIINGRSLGKANQTVELPTGRQSIEIRAAGYAGYTAVVTPREGVTQELKVRLLSEAEARMAALKPNITAHSGQQLTLLNPGPFTMGSSRRQPGRRANETQHEVELTRMFYLATSEVTNAQFRAFAKEHDSGAFKDHSLNDDDQPVVNVAWQDAAKYCNWLSARDHLPPFYTIEQGAVTGFDATATGYRLATEAEWEWAARQGNPDSTEARFPWGNDLPPPDRYGNYADRSVANLVGRIIFGFNDNYIVSAPAGTFDASKIGIHDLSGNVAEWVNDFHEIPAPGPVKNPMGPKSGDYHVIRGSSWMHGTVTELRLSFRDYGSEGRQDLGFRIARFAEAR